MAGATNRGKFLLVKGYFQRVDLVTNHYIYLITDSVAPTVDTNTVAGLVEIADGNGYVTGGYQLNPDAVDFDLVTEDDSLDYAQVRIKDVTWSAVGGDIPISGSVPRYALLTTDEATIADRQVIGWWDLGVISATPSGSDLTLTNLRIRFVES